MENAELENALDICIAKIRSGRATVEDCLQQYAAAGPALEPLLREAARLTTLPRVVMRADAIDALERRLLSRADQIRATSGSRSWLWAAILGLAIVLAVTGVWLASSSATRLPEQTTLDVTPQPLPTPTATSSPSPTHTPQATPTEKVHPTPTLRPSRTPEPTRIFKPTRKLQPTETARQPETLKPTETAGQPETLTPTEVASPTATIEPTDTPRPTDTLRPTPTETPAPPPDGWDKSSLYFDGGYGCRGNCETISAQVCNGQDSAAMAGPTTWELYWAASGNPKGGNRIADGSIEPLAAGQCQILVYNSSSNPYGHSGNYTFKTYQRPGHPGTGELWSDACGIACDASPTDGPTPTEAARPTKTPKTPKTPKG